LPYWVAARESAGGYLKVGFHDRCVLFETQLLHAC
jgi:hypothetical protein